MSRCKCHPVIGQKIITNPPSVDDDSALRSKVDEALSVYDDYMKSKTGDGANGTKEEENPEPTPA